VGSSDVAGGRTGRAAGRPRSAAFWPPAALPLVFMMIQLLGSYFAAGEQLDRRRLDGWAVALLLAGPAALWARRRYPVPTLAVVVGVTLTYLLAQYPYGPVVLSLIVVLMMSVLDGYRLAAWAGALAVYVGHFGISYLLDRQAVPAQATFGVAAWLIVVLVLAEVARFRRDKLAEAERAREEEARRRASEERLRIARELHDVLAHDISLINVQAGVALHLIDERPEQARTALTAIKQASKDALGELRSVLGVLRQDGDRPRRDPAPGLEQLDDLVARSAAAGIPVHTTIEGAPRRLPAGVGLAAYRIAQEALTNVTRHAGRATASVRVSYGERDLTVEVADDGQGAGRSAGPSAGRSAGSGAGRSAGQVAEVAEPAGGPPAGTSGGNGIPGMRERAAALGGQLEAGPRPGGGFRVLARLPLDGGS
jgi:signal transduction histidine kinase